MIPSFKFLITLFPAFLPLCSSEISILVAATSFTLEFQDFFLEKKGKKRPSVSHADQINYQVLFVIFLFFVLLFFFSIREFAAKIPRPFSVRYNPYTQSVEVLDSKDQIMKLANDIRGDVSTLHDALSKYE